MRLKQFIFALVAMLSFAVSASAQQNIYVSTVEELREALTMEIGSQRSAMQRSSAARTTDGKEVLESTNTIIITSDMGVEELILPLATVGKNMKVTIDLNGHILTGKLINNGVLTIIDSSNPPTGAIVAEGGVAIENNGTIALNSGNIIATTALDNNGTAYIQGVSLVGAVEGVDNYENAVAAITDVTLLQKAIDLASGNTEIKLAADITGDVKITQKEGVNIVIDGDGKKFTGIITVFGDARYNGAETLAIKNVNFVAKAGADACILSPDRTAQSPARYSYSHNVTVENCTFTDPDGSVDCAAIRHNDGGDRNWTVTKCTVDNTMHSLLQVNNVEGMLTVTECTVKSKNGLNLNATINATITGNNIDVNGYAVRTGVKTGGNLGTAKTLVLENNTLKSACADGDAVIMFRASSVDMDLSMTKNVVDGTTHISGNTADTKIAADANYWNGADAPVVAGIEIKVNSYYTDAALNNLERNEMGSIYAYVSADRVFGGVTSNAAETLVITLYGADGNVVGTTSLENEAHRNGTIKELTWRINFGADDSGSWAMQWENGAPSIDNLPAKVKLAVDGVEVAESDIKFTADGDGRSPVVAAKADADGKILSLIACEGKYDYTTANTVLSSNAVDGDHIAILVPGTYNVLTGKNLTITGAVDGVQFGPIAEPNMGTKNYTFNNVTFNYANDSHYKGLQYAGTMVYNNCTFNGQVFLYGTSETFNQCTFNQESANAYNVWTYSAKEVAFNECTFNCAGKSVLVYHEAASVSNNVAVTASTFIASQAIDGDGAGKGKAAIEMDASLQKNGGITLTVDDATTATGFSTNTLSGSSLWHDKKVVEGKYNGGTNTEVTIAGTVVKEAAATSLAGSGTAEAPYTINNLAELIWFAEDANAGNNYAGKFVQLAADIDLESEPWTPIATFNGVFDGNDKTISNLVVNGDGKSNQGFFGQTNNGEIKNLTIKNATVKGRLNVGVVAGTPYTSKYTNIKVTGDVVVEGMAYVGGVGGKNAYANWTDVTVDVNAGSYVKATSTEGGTAYRTYVGGVVGFNGEGGHTFKNISSNIKVVGDVMDIGGIFGILHYNNNVENVTFTGSVEAPAGAKEVGAIAGVWHNEKGTAVEISDITSTGTVTVGGTDVEDAIVGGAYNASNVTPGTSGSLKIDGEEAWLSVAKIGETNYRTVADALAAASDGETVTLLWNEGDPAIAMNGAVFGKNVTITGTATVDWSKGWFYLGRGGAGNATVTFDGANLTSASANENSGLGIHVSGREKDTNNKYDGTLVIKNSTIALDYLINRGAIELGEGAVLTVKNGFGIAGRPASETESGEAATATVTLNNGSKLVVNNHNGMGLGQAATTPEGYGIMNVNAGATFEATQAFLVTANGTMNVNGGTVKMAEGKKLTNNGAIIVSGADASTLDVATYEGNAIELRGGALADSNIGGAVNAFGTNNISGTTKIGGVLSVGYNGSPAEQVVVNITGNFNGTNVLVGSSNESILNVGVAEGARTTAHFGQLGAFGDVTINNADVTYGYAFIRNDMAVTNSALEINGGVNTYFAGNAKVVIDNSTWSLPGYANIGSYGGYMYGNADVTLKNGSSITATNLGVELAEGKEVKLTLEDTSSLTATALSNTGSIVLASADAKINANADVANVTTSIADYKIAYVNGVYTIVPMVYIVKVGDKQFETFEEALNVVENGQTIELYASANGSEINKEIEFTKDIEFTITGQAPNYELPVVTFQNATVNIKDAEILIPELDARQGAVINVINSTVHDAGGNSIAKSYYNGAINIDANSTVHMMQVTTMGYINVAGTLNATWQTNVYGNGMITVNNGATFNTAALHLTAKDYSGRDNTDSERVGKPATIVVDAANLNIGKVMSDNGADYSYNSSQGINIGTIDGKNAVLDIKNGANVNIYMANGETANIGAGGTVNVASSTFNTVCRAADGSVTLANNGTVYVTGVANLAAAKVTGNGWFYMDGVSLNANTNLVGAKVGFINGTNNLVGSTVKDGWFNVGLGQNSDAAAAAAFAAANGITMGNVVVNVSENANIGSAGNAYRGWVGSAYSADKTQHTYALNVNSSLAAFGYIHVSKDGTLTVDGRSADENRYTYDNANVNFYAGDLIVNGVVTLNNADAWAKYTKISPDAADGILNINGDTKFESSIHNGSTTGSTLVFYKAGKVNVAETAAVEVDNATALVDGAVLNIAGNVTAKGAVTGAGTVNLTTTTAKFAAADGLGVVNSTVREYMVVYADGAYTLNRAAAMIGEATYASIADAINAAQAGETVKVLSGDYTTALTVNKAITVEGETDAEGNNLVNIAGKLSISADGATVKNINVNNGSETAGVINAKNVTVEGCQVVGGNGFRYCYTSGTVTFKNSVITGSVYGIHFDGNADGDIVIDNCTITGWTSFASTITNVALKDTKFEEGNYNYVRFYQDAQITNCTFNEDMSVDIAVNNADVTVESSTVEGGKSVETLFEGADMAYSNITVDGVKLVRIAKVGDAYYQTITEAINAAADGATVEILAGEHSEYVAPWVGNSKHDTEKSITIVGAEDFATTLTAGMYLGYDDSQCREHNIVVKGIVFKGKGLKVACQQNVTIEDNKFIDITEGQAIAVVGKNINSVVKNNVIENVAAAQGIELRNTLTATVEGNTISGTSHNSLQITSEVGATNSSVNVANNTMSAWGTAGEGRAMRINGIVTANINGNVMSHTGAPEEFVKVTGSTTLNAAANYWNGVSPLTAGMFTGVEGDPIAALQSYYTDAAKSNLVTFTTSESAAIIGGVYYETLAAAIAAVKNGETITMLKACGEDVTIVQVQTKSFTIDGNNNTYTGTFTVQGDGTQNNTPTETLTFRNINFELVGAKYAITSVKGKYARNITVENCSFKGESEKSYGIRVRNGYNYTLKDVTVDGFYSFFNATESLGGFTAENVTVINTGSAFNFNYGTGIASLKNVNIDVTRAGISFVNRNASTITLENCSINAATPFVINEVVTNTNNFVFNGTNNFTATTGENWLVINDDAAYNATFNVTVNDANLDIAKASGLVAYAKNSERSFGSNKFLNVTSAMADGDVVTLVADVALTTANYVTITDNYATLCAVKEQNVTIDLNGKVITVNASAADVAGAESGMLFAVFAVDTNGNLTITDSSNGAGAVNVVANDAAVYCLAGVYGNGGKLTIENGSYTADKLSNCLIYAQHENCVTVNNGNYHLGNVGTGANGSPWIFNTYGKNVTGVTVNGGTFNTDINHTFWANEVFVPGTLALRNNGDGTWTVVPAVAYIVETATSTGSTPREVGYATLADAFAAAKSGRTVTLLQDVALENGLTVEAGREFTLDLNGKTVSMVYAETATANHSMISNKGNLTIASSVEGGKISYTYAGANLGTTYAANTITSLPGSVLTVTGGTVENLTYDSGIIAYAIDGQTNGSAGDVTVNIEGGVITSKRQAVRIFANSTTNTGALNISGGDITGRVIVQNSKASANKAALNITGGTFNANAYKSDVLYVGGSNSAAIDIDATVSGGTFKGEITDTNVTGFISGGTYDTPVDAAYCAVGYAPVAFEDGTYGVECLIVDEYVIVDDGSFAYKEVNTKSVGTLIYERRFVNAGAWQTFYVPFEIPVQTLLDLGYEVAYFYDVHFETNDEGVIDPESIPSLHVMKITSGTMKANYPYAIKPTTEDACTLELELEDVTLYPASKGTVVESSTTVTRFEFGGLYTRTICSDYAGDGVPCYTLVSSGSFKKVASTTNLTSFRVYMTIKSKDGSPVINAPEYVSMRVIGEEREDGTTTIYDVFYNETVGDDMIYDLQGRRILEPQKGEMYIINGKKVIY